METINGNDKVDCLVRTRVSAYEYNFKWILEGYSKLKNSIPIESSKFFPEVGCAWWAQLYKTDTTITVYLYRSGGYGEIGVECRVCVATGDGKLLKNKTLSMKFNNTATNFILFNSLSVSQVDIKNTGKDVVELTLLFKIYKMKANPETSSVQYSFPSEIEFQTDIQKSMMDDLEKLYETKLNADISLSIEGETLEVHKVILSVRSTVFAKMFQQEMAETAKRVVVIEDVKMSTMKEVVAFMYGKAKRDYDYDTAREVYYAADKYDVKKLKEVCGAVLASHLSEENAGQILSLADQHCDEVLKKTVMKFITFRMKSCVKTEWWSNLICNGNELTAELTEFIADFQ